MAAKKPTPPPASIVIADTVQVTVDTWVDESKLDVEFSNVHDPIARCSVDVTEDELKLLIEFLEEQLKNR